MERQKKFIPNLKGLALKEEVPCHCQSVLRWKSRAACSYKWEL